MSPTGPLVLSPDVLLVPVAGLPEEARRLLPDPEGYALTHPRARTPSQLLDARAAELVEQFRTPATIVDAVIRWSRARELDPEATLVEAFPLLERLVAAGFLVAEGSAEAQGIRPSLAPGDRVAGLTVLAPVQALEDTELYLAASDVRGGGPAALKIERPGAAGRAAPLLEREAAVLAHLDGAGIAPRLLAAGRLGERGWLAAAWCPGVDAQRAAAEAAGDRPRLLALCRAIAEAYARLHERGVVHGDVHPRNVLAGPGGEVRLIDFGAARWDAGVAPPAHGAIGFYYEPEQAASLLAGQGGIAPSFAGEQYAVAALLSLLLTGAHYLDLALVRDQMLRQIAERPPLPFAARGVEPWPEVEAVLARALAKRPEERFPEMAAMAEALAAVPSPAGERRAGRPAPRDAEALLARALERLVPGGPLWSAGLPRPRASVAYGAAGVACGLYRIALAREDPELLTAADLWAARAARDAREAGEEAFYDPGLGITLGSVGRASVYFGAAGPPCVQALVARALGEPAALAGATAAFVAAAGGPCADPDLNQGRAGLLLAAALLAEAAGPEGAAAGLADLGEGLLEGLWSELEERPPIPDQEVAPNLGMAHGWAGYLYALLRWCRAARRPLPERLGARLAELAACAQPWGRGLRWPWRGAEADRREVVAMPGWCNGSAGFVYLWTLARETLGDPSFRALAEGAAWHAWEGGQGVGGLCCGAAGRAYALLHLHRQGAGADWLARARELAGRAAREIARAADPPHSLLKGELGVAVLAADLARPEEAAFPLFAEEGWAVACNGRPEPGA